MIHRGEFWRLEQLSDRELIESLGGVVRTQQRGLAELVAHLGEVEERRLHLEAAHPSLFEYCVARLHMSEDEACRRIELARLARKFTALFPLLASGELTLSVALLLKPVLTTANQTELLEAVCGKTIRQAREILATFFPSPDVPSRIRKVPERPAAETPAKSVPAGHATSAPRPAVTERALPSPTIDPPTRSRKSDLVLTPPPAHSRIEPIAAQRYKVQFTADASIKEKLELARDLLRHTHPDGDLGPIVSRALDLLIADLKRTRFGMGTRPKSTQPQGAPTTSANSEPPARPVKSGASTAESRTPPSAANHSHVSRAARRAVLERDGFACTWVDEHGRRCGSRAWLELDHRHPRAKGGRGDPANLRVLCHAHNQLAAEHEYGREHVARARERRTRARRQARAAPPDGATAPI